jgi:hypothetical protein
MGGNTIQRLRKYKDSIWIAGTPGERATVPSRVESDTGEELKYAQKYHRT